MKHVLITGGAGFIGSNLSLKLIERGYYVRVLDNLSPQIHGNEKNSYTYNIVKEKVDFLIGDVRIKEDWEKALQGIDIVVHLAAETGTGQSMYEIEKYVDINCRGTAILLDILTNKKTSVKKIVLASSRAVYGEGKYHCKNHGNVYPLLRADADMKMLDFECKCPDCGGSVRLLPTCEESKIHPTSIYGITKQNQEQMFLTIGKALNISTVIYRYQNVYGPGQSLSNPYTGILSIFSTLIKNGKHLNIFEDGKESRDFVFIDDVTDATILGIEKEQSIFDVFNVGSDEPISVLKVANTLKEYYNSNTEINVSGNYRIGDIRHNYADLTKITKMLGFKPNYSFKKGISLFCQWVNQQEIATDSYDKSINEMKSKNLFK